MPVPCSHIESPSLAVSKARGVKMPSFLGYMRWSAAVLLPLFALIAALFL